MKIVFAIVLTFMASQLAATEYTDGSRFVHFYVKLTNEETVPYVQKDNVSGQAKAWLVGTRQGIALKYVIETNMDANAGWPVTKDITDDISKIHLHNNSVGLAGPHVLNIYKGPAQDDDDLKVHATRGAFTGRWDRGDTNDDGLPAGPATEPFSWAFLKELCNGNIYVNLHGTNADGTSDSGVLRGNFAPTQFGKRICQKWRA